MSEFTPSTTEVRDGYRFDSEVAFYDPIHEEAIAREAGRAFDRWLAQHDTEIREQIASEIEATANGYLPRRKVSRPIGGIFGLCISIVRGK